MPRRPSIHNAVSPHTSSNAVNDVINALSRKLGAQHIDVTAVSPTSSRTSSRRSSFKMDHILNPAKKEKKRNDSTERVSRDGKKGPLALRPVTKSKDRTTSRNSSTGSAGAKVTVPGKFEMIMESPPAVLHGSTSYSTGALLSGRVKLDVEDPAGELTLSKFTMILQVSTTTKKPVAKECKECSTKHETIKEWNFLSEAKTFKKGKDNQFPWSHLLPGRFPATTNSQLGTVSYSFIVQATTVQGESIKMIHPLQVSRAIPSGGEKASIRIFPPTNLTGRVNMSPVVHPIGKFPVSMTLSGVVERKEQSQTRWRLKKMMWRIEEHSKIKSTPCDKHKNKVSEGKAVQHTESRQLGSDEMKGGWKTDFDTAGGEISLDFEAQLATRPSHKATCDVDSGSGLEVKHNLVIELIVAEEFVPNKNTNLITPTGAARVLRMQFALVVTDRAGMGISWDDEMPPMYEDVPPSPPGYGNADKSIGAFGGAEIEDYIGPDFEYLDLERIPTSNPADPPIYREMENADINAGLPMRQSDLEVPNTSTAHQRLGGFRLEELEAEPQFSLRRRASDESGEDAVDYGEGSAGAAEPQTRRGR